MPKSDFNKVAKQVAFWHGCSPVNMLHISKHLFLRTLVDGCFCYFLFLFCNGNGAGNRQGYIMIGKLVFFMLI